ncbi:MAG TPA: hypothetical protein VHM30_17765 [Gemmatimonadaceae bacterium]|nr:hypothetical protein [Gemmatimonadaceae bacterium]
MSYAPNPTRIGNATRETSGARTGFRDRPSNGEGRGQRRTAGTAGKGRTTPRGRSFEEARDWKQIAVVATGIAAGAAIGAGLALLFTDETGPERRAGIARRARRFGHDAEQKWEDLAFELKEAARAARDRIRLRRARKAAADDETEADD